MAPGKNPTAHVGMRNLKNNKLYLQVYDEIKSYIIKNRLKAGDKLPTEMEMCSFLGVSRNVLREHRRCFEQAGRWYYYQGIQHRLPVQQPFL